MTEKRIDKYVFNTKDTIGAGAFGTVFKAHHVDTNQYYALKAISKQKIFKDEYSKQGLLSEIRIMKNLRSPNIVQLVDVLETPNNYYIIQELCGQGDLAKLMKMKKIIPEWQAVQIMTDILRGFIELIKNGVIHRDLKPANILLGDNKFKLADFGFAKCVDNFAKQLFVSSVGTPLYMSPQILRSEKYTTKSDIWSFGFIFYELLYGTTPWTGSSIPQLVDNIKKLPLTFDDKKNQVSDESKDAIRKCLQIKEADRIAWIDIYKHPVFNSQFKDFSAIDLICERKEKFIANRLREKIEVKQIELEDLFEQFGFEQKKHLDMRNLGELFTLIDPDIQRIEVEYIFNNIDRDSSGTIDFQEFKDWLIENEVRLSVRLSTQPQLHNANTITLQKQQSSLEEEYSAEKIHQGYEITHNLQIIIQEHNINLKELFDKFNSDMDGLLTLQEYCAMILTLIPEANDEAIEVSFRQFDEDNHKYCYFQDFKNVLEQFKLPSDIIEFI